MKKLILMVAALFVGIYAAAQFDSTVAISRGTYITESKIDGSSNTGTAFLSSDNKRLDAVLFNNTGSTIWIGTTTAAQYGQTHDNVVSGFPVLSSATFKLDGKIGDALYFTCGDGISTCNVRVLEGKIR